MGASWRRAFGAALTLLALSVTGAATADPRQAPATAPANDAYLESLALNQPGTRLDGTHTLRDVRDTTLATTQADLFDPPQSGGGAEVTSCRGVSYATTVWYDLHPHADGTISVRTSGYDNVIALYRFDRDTLKPDVDGKRCVNRGDFPSEQLVAKVKRGRSYTVQIGGVNGVGGSLEALFDYAREKLARLAADATLTAGSTPAGIELKGLRVATSRKATVAVRCDGHCRPRSEQGAKVQKFPSLKGVRMPAGSKLQIRVTAPSSIGVHIQYNVRRGSFQKVTRCLRPGSKKPRRKCQ